jgi:hypothetical protein
MGWKEGLSGARLDWSRDRPVLDGPAIDEDRDKTAGMLARRVGRGLIGETRRPRERQRRASPPPEILATEIVAFAVAIDHAGDHEFRWSIARVRIAGGGEDGFGPGDRRPRPGQPIRALFLVKRTVLRHHLEKIEQDFKVVGLALVHFAEL